MACVRRLQREFRALCKEPVPHIVARPSPDDIRDWHYVLEGCEGTPFAGGYYYGKIKFPPDYPYNPPGISIATPNGRFMTQEKICLSMSDYHPESWNPMWRVSRPEGQRRNDQRQSATIWMLLFLLMFLVVGAVMALPLLQL